jgi:hypothetical protein
MNETLACSECGRPLHVPDDLRGQAVKCPACHHTFVAPEAGYEPVPQAQAAVPSVYEERPAVYAEAAAYDDGPRHPPTEVYPREYPVGPRSEAPELKPGKVQAVAIMTLVGGIFAILVSIGWVSTCVGLAWPPMYFSFVLGVMAIVKASNLLGQTAYREKPPRAIAIMQIVNILNGDVINLTLGIITLVFLGDREVRDYFGC